jgi:hypothetical protein
VAAFQTLRAPSGPWEGRLVEARGSPIDNDQPGRHNAPSSCSLPSLPAPVEATRRPLTRSTRRCTCTPQDLLSEVLLNHVVPLKRVLLRDVPKGGAALRLKVEEPS